MLYTLSAMLLSASLKEGIVNLCAIDLSKAFDKMNHHALLMKLMKRNLPLVLIDILENWLKIGKMGLCTLIHICCKIWS